MLNRIFLALLVVFAGGWIWAAVSFHLQSAEDEKFYAARVAPYLADSKRQSEAFNTALEERRQGKKTPLPLFQPLDSKSLTEWIDRRSKSFEYKWRATQALFGIYATVIAWIVTNLIRQFQRQRRIAATDRPAAADAGKLIDELVRLKRGFVANGTGGSARQIHIDGEHSVVVFRHYAFVSSFLSNPKLDRVELPFRDLLSGYILHYQGRPSLHLRTTRGKVLVNDSIHPFPTLAELLLDIIEVNRKSPALYRESLSRERRIHTPWYGWLIVGLAVAAVLALLWSIL